MATRAGRKANEERILNNDAGWNLGRMRSSAVLFDMEIDRKTRPTASQELGGRLLS